MVELEGILKKHKKNYSSFEFINQAKGEKLLCYFQEKRKEIEHIFLQRGKK